MSYPKGIEAWVKGRRAAELEARDSLTRLVAELQRTEGDLAVAVREAVTARAERDEALAAAEALRGAFAALNVLDRQPQEDPDGK